MAANHTACGQFVLACACLAHGCVSHAPEREMLRHDWRLAGEIRDAASDRAVADAQAKVLAALVELRAALESGTAAASDSRSELAAILRAADPGAPPPASFANPKRLEEDMLGLLGEAADAPTPRLVQFRDSIRIRSNPGGMDPVRRAILDHEIRMRRAGWRG